VSESLARENIVIVQYYRRDNLNKINTARIRKEDLVEVTVADSDLPGGHRSQRVSQKTPPRSPLN
jgi:hypothetical protein